MAQHKVQIIKLFNNGDEHFHVRHTLVRGSHKNPPVLLLHGLDGSFDKPHNLAFAAATRRAGFSTLEINARYSASNDSYGVPDDFTISGHIADIETAVRWVEDHHPEWLKTGKPILIGHSMGGIAVVESASRHKSRYSRVIALGAVASGKSLTDILARDESWKAGRHEENPFGNTGKSHRITTKKWREWETHDLAKIAPYITVPVEFITGALDDLTPGEYVRAIAALMPDARFTAVPDANHIFRNRHEELMLNEIYEGISAALHMKSAQLAHIWRPTEREL
jgi:pimeloyl-ACP methyl ester carboxylesterase